MIIDKLHAIPLADLQLAIIALLIISLVVVILIHRHDTRRMDRIEARQVRHEAEAITEQLQVPAQVLPERNNPQPRRVIHIEPIAVGRG